MDLVLLGELMIVVGCLSSAVGMLYMKLSSEVGEASLPLCQRWRWAVGFVLLVVNATAFDIIAYGMTPLSMIAPFAGLTIVFSSLLAWTGLLTKREQLTPSGAAATVLVIGGITGVSVFGPRGDGSPSVLRLTADSVALVAAAFGLVAVWLILRRTRLAPPHSSWLMTIASSTTSACCGLVTQVALKQISGTVVTSVMAGSTRAWSDPLTWGSFVAIGLSSPLQLYLLNETLAGAKVSLAVPAYQSTLIVMNLLAAGVVYGEARCASRPSRDNRTRLTASVCVGEFEHASPQQLYFFGGGVACSIVGLVMLTLADEPAESSSEPLGDRLLVVREAQRNRIPAGARPHPPCAVPLPVGRRHPSPHAACHSLLRPWSYRRRRRWPAGCGASEAQAWPLRSALAEPQRKCSTRRAVSHAAFL